MRWVGAEEVGGGATSDAKRQEVVVLVAERLHYIFLSPSQEFLVRRPPALLLASLVRRRNILPPGMRRRGWLEDELARHVELSALSPLGGEKALQHTEAVDALQLRALGASEHADELLPNARAVLEEVGRSGQAGVFSSEVAERVGLAAQTHFVAETLERLFLLRRHPVRLVRASGAAPTQPTMSLQLARLCPAALKSTTDDPPSLAARVVASLKAAPGGHLPTARVRHLVGLEGPDRRKDWAALVHRRASPRYPPRCSTQHPSSYTVPSQRDAESPLTTLAGSWPSNTSSTSM